MPRDPESHDLLIGLLLVQSLMERRSEAFFQPFGLTAAQFNILNLLGYHNGRMDRDSLVQREEHPKDRRQVVLILTSKGRALWRKIFPSYEENVAQLFGSIPTSRRYQFLNDLKTLYDAFLAEERTPDLSSRWHVIASPQKLA
jgi:DNA-binding MarR family transcriptional regulator